MTERPCLRLASSSPRRRKILTEAGIPFVLLDPMGDGPTVSGSPGNRVLGYASYKAAAGRRQCSLPVPILAADTLVFLGDVPLAQPQDREAAEAMLRSLSGREHQVWTGVVLLDSESRTWSQADCSVVAMDILPEQVLTAYLDSEEWRGKAGGYAIQGHAGSFAHLQSGSLQNVIGLDPQTVQALLAKAGLKDLGSAPCPDGGAG